jgi:hypothetical protein
MGGFAEKARPRLVAVNGVYFRRIERHTTTASALTSGSLRSWVTWNCHAEPCEALGETVRSIRLSYFGAKKTDSIRSDKASVRQAPHRRTTSRRALPRPISSPFL